MGVALVALGLVYPAVTTVQRTDGFRKTPTLDGFAFLKQHQPEDYQAAQWLIENVPGHPVVLEAVGGPYSHYARIATQTGLPTVLGWPQHERLWRGAAAEGAIAERERDIDTIYRASNLAEVRYLLDRYNVEYIVYGYLEANKYRGLRCRGTCQVRHRPGNGISGRQYSGLQGRGRCPAAERCARAASSRRCGSGMSDRWRSYDPLL